MDTIIHVINNFKRGGTETFFVNLLPELKKHYKIVLVTLSPENEFGEYVFDSCDKYYCLNHKSHSDLFTSINKLKSIIKTHHPVLVRSLLVWSSIIARMACPGHIPLVFSVHATMEEFLDGYKGRAMAFLEQLTLSKKHTMIGVTQTVVDEYVKKFRFKGPSHPLYNYIKDDFFSENHKKKHLTNNLRLVAVGNLKDQKNYFYLIEAFKKLKGLNVVLDIYGDGPLHKVLLQQINAHKLPINLKGKVSNISKLLQEYDALVMLSTFEGFANAAIEAMASEIPLILSDIPSLREVTGNNAFFIDISSPDSFVNIIKLFLTKGADLSQYTCSGKKLAENRYRKALYFPKLLNIYWETIERHKVNG